MERTIVVVKPDAMQKGLGGPIIGRLEKVGLRLIGLKMIHISRALATKQYEVHNGKPFFEKLVNLMTSAPVIIAVFAGDKAVETVRKAVGTTDPAKAEKGTIRSDYGTNVTVNAIHAADSTENAEKEIKLFFTEKELFPGK